MMMYVYVCYLFFSFTFDSRLEFSDSLKNRVDHASLARRQRYFLMRLDSSGGWAMDGEATRYRHQCSPRVSAL